MLLTLDETDTNRPLAHHGHRKPDHRLVAGLLALRIAELPASSLRKQAIEQMIAEVRG